MSAKQPSRPMVDIWYKASNGAIFEVVATDEKDDAIEIQYLDGSLEELDDDVWESLDPKVIAPPREALAEASDSDEGEADYEDAIDLDGNEGDWSSSLEEYE